MQPHFPGKPNFLTSFPRVCSSYFTTHKSLFSHVAPRVFNAKEAINVEDETFLRLISHTVDGCGSNEEIRKTSVSAKTAVKRTGKKKSGGKQSKSSTKTSTGKSGVGYETGEKSFVRSNVCCGKKFQRNNFQISLSDVERIFKSGTNTSTSSSKLKEEMHQASKRQRALDEKCCEVMKSVVSFLSSFSGDEGVVLLALKMSPGFNRMLFSLFKNDSLFEWGKRRDVYLIAIDLVEQLGELFYSCGSKFRTIYMKISFLWMI